MRQRHTKITPRRNGAGLQRDHFLIQGNRFLRITPIVRCNSFLVEFFSALSLLCRRGDQRKKKKARDG
jgi:hypothetical protein